MAKRTITGRLFVSISEYSSLEQLKDEDEQYALGALSFTHCDITGDGFSHAGMATVTVELCDDQELVENKAESLRAEITKVRAESENTITQLTQKLNSLLAIAA